MALKFDKKEILRNLESRAREGVKAAAEYVKDESISRTPKEFGDLRASAGQRITQHNLPQISATIFYTETYAPMVHESVEEKLRGLPRPSGVGTYWSPNAESKFLEKALFQNRQTVKAIIKKHMAFS